jgi:hypothetical protein
MGYNLDDHHAHSDLNTRTVQILNDKNRLPEDDFTPGQLRQVAEKRKQKEASELQKQVDAIILAFRGGAEHAANAGKNEYINTLPTNLAENVRAYFSARGFGTEVSNTNVLTLRW